MIVVQKVLQKNENKFTAEGAEEAKHKLRQGKQRTFFAAKRK
jgi:hypothetical protein